MKENGSLFLKRRMMREYHVRCCKSLGVKYPWLLDHARRKFVEARLNDQARADYVLDQIQLLYAIERKAADEQLSEADILQLCQENAMPILESLGKWMQGAYLEVLPKSAIGMALAYSIQRWAAINGLCHGRKVEYR